MAKLQVKKFAFRKELELAIAGDTTFVEGTREELAALHLSGRTKINGIICVETDPETKSLPKAKPNRGTFYESKINGNKIKTK